MNQRWRGLLAVMLTGLWVNVSEFVRNELLLRNEWRDHYRALGLTFPSTPQNGAVWVLWGFLLATAIYGLSRKFSLLQTALLGWFMAFAMMWVVVWNLNVLPGTILIYAVPLSMLEALVGAGICRKIAPSP